MELKFIALVCLLFVTTAIVHAQDEAPETVAEEIEPVDPVPIADTDTAEGEQEAPDDATTEAPLTTVAIEGAAPEGTSSPATEAGTTEGEATSIVTAEITVVPEVTEGTIAEDTTAESTTAGDTTAEGTTEGTTAIVSGNAEDTNESTAGTTHDASTTVDAVTATTADQTTAPEVTEPTTTASTDPCHISNHDKVKVTGDFARLTEEKGECQDLPVNKWVAFEQDGSPMSIVNFDEADYCFLPGACNTQFPYYIQNLVVPAPNEETTADFCMSDGTMAGKALCCEEKTDIAVYNCVDYLMYKFNKPMSRRACGAVCTAPGAEQIRQALYVVKNEGTLPLDFNKLDKEAQDNVVNVELTVGIEDLYWEREVIILDGLKQTIADQLDQAAQSGRRKRAADDYEVHLLKGSPDRKEDKVTLLLAATDANGDPVSKDKLLDVLKVMEENPDKTQVAWVSGSEPGTAGLVEPEKPMDDKDPKPVTTRGPGDKLWIAIIIIIAVVAGIVLIAFIAVWCFRTSRKGRTGNMTVSQKTALVEDNDESYRPNGHDNMAMEQEDKNGKVKGLDSDKAVIPLDENQV